MTTEHHGLGRLVAIDPRDTPYAIEVRRMPTPPAKRVSKIWPLFRQVLDQGNTGTCVGHGWRHFLEGAPIVQTTRKEEPFALTIYREAIAIDEWPENDNGDLNFGTSVRAGWKALRARGLVGEGNSTNNVDVMADWIGGKDELNQFIGGGLVIGVPWYPSMFDPTPEGFLTIPAGQTTRYGHCVWINGWNQPGGYFWGVNSWGNWGPKRGRFRISGEIMDRLMKETGEAWTAKEIRL